MLKRIILILLLAFMLLAAKKPHRSRRSTSKLKGVSSKLLDQSQGILQKSYNSRDQQIEELDTQIVFGEPPLISQSFKQIVITSFFYLLAGVGVVAICYYVLRKLYESEVDQLCKNHQMRGLERRIQRQEMDDIANGVRMMKKPQEMRSKMRHKIHYL